MKQLHNKISDQRGASLLMSLLLLLVSVMICVVSLSAAISAKEARQNAFDEQQKYLIVSSAAELFIGELQDLEFEAYHYAFYGPNGSWDTFTTEDKQEVSVWTRDGSEPYKIYCPLQTNDEAGQEFINNSGKFSKSGTFVDMMSNAVKALRNGEQTSITETHTIQASSFAPVKMTFQMDKRFAVTATFALATDNSYQIQVKAVPTLIGESFSTNPSIPVQPEITYPYENLASQKDQILKKTFENSAYADDGFGNKLTAAANNHLGSVGLTDRSIPPFDNEFGTTERYMKLQWNTISVTKGGTQ